MLLNVISDWLRRLFGGPELAPVPIPIPIPTRPREGFRR